MPTAINGTSTFTALAAGPGSHACALDAAGAAWCTGRNDAGQLGNGGFVDAAAFVAVRGGLRFAAITAGGRHSCGLTAAGAAWCWGSGTWGQLGDGRNGTSYNQTAPVAVAGGLAFAAIAAGGDHTCALTAAGRPHCWGRNDKGQLGTGTYASSAAPVPVIGGLAVASISAGGEFTCGLNATGGAWCFGGGPLGQRRACVLAQCMFVYCTPGGWPCKRCSSQLPPLPARLAPKRQTQRMDSWATV